jgi:hypothetical protein
LKNVTDTPNTGGNAVAAEEALVLATAAGFCLPNMGVGNRRSDGSECEESDGLELHVEGLKVRVKL